MSDSEEGDIELWGWQTFFHELGRFLESSGSFFDTASQSYANYAVERLETCIISLNAVKEILEAAREDLEDYKRSIEELLSVCRSLSRKWEQKLTAEMLQPRYHLSVENRPGRGRPRFAISKEQ